MSTGDIYFWWVLWMAFAGVIVAAAALLLLIIIGLAHRITRLAGVALEVVGEIEGNTRSIWDLNTTNKVADNIAAGAEAIADNTETIGGALTAGGYSARAGRQN